MSAYSTTFCWVSCAQNPASCGRQSVPPGLGRPSGRQLGDEPIRRWHQRDVVRVEIDVPGIRPAADVSWWRGDDIAAVGADIDALAERRVLHLLSGDIANLDGVGLGEQDVLTTTAGNRAPGSRQFAVLAQRLLYSL
jgi:hypothetical protein